MKDKKIINTFSFTQPVNEQVVELQLCCFSSRTASSNDWKYTYTLVGKIKGISYPEGDADIIADYQGGMRLSDKSTINDNRFIYSNESKVPVVLEMNVHCKGVLPWQGLVDVWFLVKLKHSSQRFTVHAASCNFKQKGNTKAKFSLMQ
jgi:hypothetical protein